MITLLLALLVPSASATELTLSSVAEIKGGYECNYQECGHYDEEGYWVEDGPIVTMTSSTPCPDTISGFTVVDDSSELDEMDALLPDRSVAGIDDDPGIQANIQVCIDMPLNTTFCYIDTYTPSCHDYALAQPGGTIPTGTSCEDVI